jgi:hypothetical protein
VVVPEALPFPPGEGPLRILLAAPREQHDSPQHHRGGPRASTTRTGPANHAGHPRTDLTRVASPGLLWMAYPSPLLSRYLERAWIKQSRTIFARNSCICGRKTRT